MKWTVLAKNIVDHPADVLICSANIALNLSGAVGGELLERYGPSVQTALHEQLKLHGRKFAEPGDVICTRVATTPYKAIIHAVAVDGFQSSIRMISTIVRESLNQAAAVEARTVVLAARLRGMAP